MYTCSKHATFLLHNVIMISVVQGTVQVECVLLVSVRVCSGISSFDLYV